MSATNPTLREHYEAGGTFQRPTVLKVRFHAWRPWIVSSPGRASRHYKFGRPFHTHAEAIEYAVELAWERATE